jgi:hypothetical protein
VKKIKKAKPFSKKYRPVVVYLDAMQEIYDTMKAISEKVELSSDDYKFDSLDDAKEHFGSRPQFVFTLSASVPYVQVEFSRMEAKVYVAAGDKSAQLFHELDAIMTGQQRAFGVLYSQWLWVPTMLASVASGTLSDRVPQIYALPALILGLALFAWYIWIAYVGMRRQSLLFFVRRSQAQTFMELNRNAIVLTIVTSLISGAIGYGFARLKDKATSEPPAVVNPPNDVKK